MIHLVLSRLVHRLAAVVTAVLLALFCTSIVASSTVMAPFQSHYSVDYSGFGASRVVSLERAGPDYILRSTTKLKGFARLSGFGPVYEVSRFEMHDGVIRPLLYTVGDGQNKHKRDIRI
jgi:opacity protein-like surface antigen